MESNITISKETANRLLKDVKQIMKHPLNDNGIYYQHDETNMLKGYALIVGPSDTPYFSGFYMFKFDFPTDYPYKPPKVTYLTNSGNVRFNPNLYTSGKVCVSILNTWSGDQWSSCQTISSVLLTLCTLLCDKPLLNEPGITEQHADLNNYSEIITFSNISIAICDMLNKKEGLYLPIFDIFYHIMKQHFIKNVDKLIEIVENKIIDNKTDVKKTIHIRTYLMNVVIDYNLLLKKIHETKNNITV